MFLANKLNKGAGAPAAPADAQFNYVTMLLHGDGTNGAQNKTFLDSSTNNFTITRNGNTTQGSFSPYGSNWSNFFSYNSTAVNYLTSNSLSLSGTFTIETFVYWDGVGSVPVIFTLGDSSLSTGMEIYKSGSDWVVYSDNAARITGSAAVVGQWTYISVSRTGSTVTMYINGVSQGTWTSSTTFSGTIKVGAEFYGGGYSSSMSGYISNFRVNNTTAINTVPTAPLTAVSGTIFLTCQSNRFVDNSINNFAITVNGTPSVQRFNPFGTPTAYSTSVIGGSGYFDGSGDYLTVPDDVQFNLTTSDYTMEMWVYPTTFASLNVPFAYGWTSGSGTRLIVFIQNTNGTYQIYYNDASNTFTTTNTVKLNAWNHLALVRNGSNFDFYINGVSSASATNSFSYPDSSFPIVIGSSWSGSTGSFFYTGYISDVRICVGAAVYTSGFTPPTAPLTTANTPALLCKFTNGAIFDNAMMNDLETVGNTQISTSVKKYGTGSLAFDGTGDYLSTRSTPNLSFGSGDFTIEAWVYATSLGSYNAVFAQWPDNGGSTNNSYTLETVGSNMEFYYASGSTLYGPTTLGTITTGVWIHYAICRSGNTLYPFKNGVLGTTTSITQTLNSPTSAVTVGGAVAGGGEWIGYIDDLRITKGYARYTANFTPPTAALPDIGPI